MTRAMTDRELQHTIQYSNEALYNLSSLPKPKEPFTEQEVHLREVILLRQVTAYKIQEARERGEKDLELLNTDIYRTMTSFLESH